MQRLTAIANVVLMLSFVVIVAQDSCRGFAEARLLVCDPPGVKSPNLALLSVTIHMRLGMQVIIRGLLRVHAPAMKIAAVLANNAYAVASWPWPASTRCCASASTAA